MSVSASSQEGLWFPDIPECFREHVRSHKAHRGHPTRCAPHRLPSQHSRLQFWKVNRKLSQLSRTHTPWCSEQLFGCSGHASAAASWDAWALQFSIWDAHKKNLKGRCEGGKRLRGAVLIFIWKGGHGLISADWDICCFLAEKVTAKQKVD